MIDFIKEFLSFILRNKKFILIPFVLVLILMALIIFVGSSTAISPFIYTLF